jgi:hypothetical protein
MDLLVLAAPTGVRLEISPARQPYAEDQGKAPAWTARLIGNGCNATVLFTEQGWQPISLAGFFASLDADWRGLDGARTWLSSEHEIMLEARHDGVGAVTVTAELRDGAPPRWSCAAELALDPGGFASLAAEIRRLERVSLTL